MGEKNKDQQYLKNAKHAILQACKYGSINGLIILIINLEKRISELEKRETERGKNDI